MNDNAVPVNLPSPSRAVVMEMKMMSNVSAIMMCASIMEQTEEKKEEEEGVSDDQTRTKNLDRRSSS